MKRRIRLTEGDLRRIVNRSVRRVLRESDEQLINQQAKEVGRQLNRYFDFDNVEEGETYWDGTLYFGESEISVHVYNYGNNKLTAAIFDEYGTDLYNYVSAYQGKPLGERPVGLSPDEMVTKLSHDIEGIINLDEYEDY